uniref:Uncharacterized protein n=1 Tax=viral metagenome TaxID=1070528 RepID=A0A6M3LFQ5_9ZZZZ
MWISKNKLGSMRQEAYESGRKDLEGKNKALWESVNKAESARIEIQKKHDELISKLRTQSENDMIAEAVKLIFKGITGEKKEALLPYHQQMIAAQQGMSSYWQQLGVLIGDLLGPGYYRPRY